MGSKRGACSWATSAEDYLQYHDEEWGIPLYDDHLTFEFLLLETFQAGLSWIMILRKRDAFRRAFHNFDVDQVAAMTEEDVKRLCTDASIVRNRAKIVAAIDNARAVICLREEGMGLAEYFWRWVGFVPVDTKLKRVTDCPSKTELAEKVSKDLKRRGFKFVGATVVYAHLQATGVVNDHVIGCGRYEEVKKMIRVEDEWRKMGVDVGKWGDGSEWWEKMEEMGRTRSGKVKSGKKKEEEMVQSSSKSIKGSGKKRKKEDCDGGEVREVRRSRRLMAQ